MDDRKFEGLRQRLSFYALTKVFFQIRLSDLDDQ